MVRLMPLPPHWGGYLSEVRCRWFAYGPADANHLHLAPESRQITMPVPHHSMLLYILHWRFNWLLYCFFVSLICEQPTWARIVSHARCSCSNPTNSVKVLSIWLAFLNLHLLYHEPYRLYVHTFNSLSSPLFHDICGLPVGFNALQFITHTYSPLSFLCHDCLRLFCGNTAPCVASLWHRTMCLIVYNL